MGLREGEGEGGGGGEGLTASPVVTRSQVRVSVHFAGCFGAIVLCLRLPVSCILVGVDVLDSA